MTNKSYVLVSGGKGGIGTALCSLLPRNNLTPVIGYSRNPDQAKELARECGGLALPLNLACDNSIAQALLQLAGKLGEGDTLAGVVLAASPPPDLFPFGKLTAEMLLRQFRVNVVGPQLLLSGLVKAHFRKNKSGFVIGILSKAIGDENHPPVTGMGAYIIAKSAMRSLLEVCAAEYPWLKVRTLRPGFTRTPMLEVFDERYLEMMQANAPFASAEEVAHQILKEILP